MHSRHCNDCSRVDQECVESVAWVPCIVAVVAEMVAVD